MSDEAGRLRHRTLWLGWGAITFGLLAIVAVLALCVLMYALILEGIG